MSEFVIYPQKVRQTYDGFDTCSRSLSNCYNSLYSIRDTLSNISSLSGVVRPVEIVAKRLETQENTVQGLKAVLGSCVQLYENADGRCIGSTSAVTLTKTKSDTTTPDVNVQKVEKDDNKLWTWKDTWKVAKEFGIIGSGIGAIGGLITGGITPKTAVGALKDSAKFVGKVSKASSKNSFDWKTLFGFNKFNKPMNFYEAFGKKINDYNFGNATKVSEKIAVGAKWAGTALTIVTTAMDNFDKKSGNSIGRAFAETVGESAFKIGEGILLGAAFTAVASTVGAPVVVAGLATVAATWVIDKGFELVKGKNAAEYISDKVIDGVVAQGKRQIETVKKTVNNIGNAVSSFGKKLSGWWNREHSLAW